MRHSDVFGHLGFKRIDLRPERSDPIACERLLDELEFFAAHVRRGQVDAWQHRFIHFEQLESRPALPWPARERAMRPVPYPAQKGSDRREKTKAKWPAARVPNPKAASVETARDTSPRATIQRPGHELMASPSRTAL